MRLRSEIEAGDPALDLTLDVVEYRGFEYHSGVTFTLFAPGVRGELGSGGRYQAGLNDSENSSEAATGFTLFLDSILRALEPGETMPKVYLPAKTSRADGQGVRDQGYRTLQGHTDYGDINVAATRLGCSHIWLGGYIKPLGTV
jgi:ATP phosphoribosyltransferase regulatory subunit